MKSLCRFVLKQFSNEARKGILNSPPPKAPPKAKIAKYIFAVGSGKGGVGKSSISARLALAFSDKEGLNLKTGILDCDLYGPSVAKLMGIEQEELLGNDKNKILPINVCPGEYNLKAISIANLIPASKAIAWRGPMLTSALNQFVNDVEWGDMDVLVLDLPPGTGDVALSINNIIDISGAVVISTPQDVALIDAMRAVDMFKQQKISVLGMLENMSFFECPNCHHKSHIFGHGGVEKMCKKYSIDFLQSFPYSPTIMANSDAGLVQKKFQDKQVQKDFSELAKKLIGIVDSNRKLFSN